MAPRPDDLTSPHAEPNHYEKYGFCRVGCEECDRLDHEEMEQGMPSAVALSRGVMLALAAVDGEPVKHDWLLPKHEFSEDVNDGSMCKCGVPALGHEVVEP